MSNADTLGLLEMRLEDTSFWGTRPWDVFRRLRHDAPVFYYEPGGFWILSKYQNIREAFGDPQRYSIEYGSMLGDNYDPEDIRTLPDWARASIDKDELTRAEIRKLVSDSRFQIEGAESIGQIDPPR